MCDIFITNNALIGVDSAPVHTNTLRYERNLGGFGTRHLSDIWPSSHREVTQ